MHENPIYEMMAAFAVGCMDKENFIQFKEYLLDEGELPRKELGELQTIVSMIPIILDLEVPDPSIKDNVAKRLIGMQDEIKTKIREEKQKTYATRGTKSADFPPTNPRLSNVTPLPDTTENKSTEQFTNNFRSTAKIEVSQEDEKIFSNELRRTNKDLQNQPQSLFPRPTQSEEMPDQKQPDTSKTAIGLIVLLMTIILLTVTGIFTYDSISTLDEKVGQLETKLGSLRNELATSTNFVNRYNSLIEFLNYKDLTLVNLYGTDPGDYASAKVLLAFEEREGLIQFKNVKHLQPSQGYQLWLVSRGQSYSLGVFSPNGDEYLRITYLPLIPKEQIDMIKVTIESISGSPTPSVESYLQGTLRQK